MRDCDHEAESAEGRIVSAPVWPDHLLSLDEWDQLPEYDRFKVEVVEGVLIVSPRPLLFHQRAIHKLVHALNVDLPEVLSAVAEVEVVIDRSPATVRVPDIGVTTTAFAESNPARVPAVDVHLAVEVLSEGTVRTDRIMKFAEYAEAGIRRYWLVDLTTPMSLSAFTLVDSIYELVGEYTGSVTVPFDGSHVSIDLPTLTAR